MDTLTTQLLHVIENRNFGADDVLDTQAVYSIFKLAKGTELETVCCNLFNFASDTMARQEDRYYRKAQEIELNKLVRLLKSGDLQQAKTISFLGEE